MPKFVEESETSTDIRPEMGLDLVNPFCLEEDEWGIKAEVEAWLSGSLYRFILENKLLIWASMLAIALRIDWGLRGRDQKGSLRGHDPKIRWPKSIVMRIGCTKIESFCFVSSKNLQMNTCMYEMYGRKSRNLGKGGKCEINVRKGEIGLETCVGALES